MRSPALTTGILLLISLVPVSRGLAQVPPPLGVAVVDGRGVLVGPLVIYGAPGEAYPYRVVLTVDAEHRVMWKLQEGPWDLLHSDTEVLYLDANCAGTPFVPGWPPAFKPLLLDDIRARLTISPPGTPGATAELVYADLNATPFPATMAYSQRTTWQRTDSGWTGTRSPCTARSLDTILVAARRAPIFFQPPFVAR